MGPGNPVLPEPVIEDDEPGWQPPSEDAPTPSPYPRVEEFIRIDPTSVDESFDLGTE